LRRFAAWFLAAEGLGTAVWWLALLLAPRSRTVFLPAGTPDFLLWSLLIPDVLLFGACALASAGGFARGHAWGVVLLWVHAGAGAYAGLFAVGLAVLTGEAWVGAAMMTPSLVILPYLVWHFRPGNAGGKE
jgi:hypothetical protein